jgi:hypothetical protein
MTGFVDKCGFPEHPGTGGNATNLPSKTQQGDATAAPDKVQQHLTGNNRQQVGGVPPKSRSRDPHAWDVV